MMRKQKVTSGRYLNQKLTSIKILHRLMVIKIWFTALVIQKNMTNSSVIQKIILLTTAVAFPYFFPDHSIAQTTNSNSSINLNIDGSKRTENLHKDSNV